MPSGNSQLPYPIISREPTIIYTICALKIQINVGNSKIVRSNNTMSDHYFCPSYNIDVWGISEIPVSSDIPRASKLCVKLSQPIIPYLSLEIMRDSKYTQGTLKVRPRYTQGTPKVYSRYTKATLKVHPRPTQDTPKVYTR